MLVGICFVLSITNRTKCYGLFQKAQGIVGGLKFIYKFLSSRAGFKASVGYRPVSARTLYTKRQKILLSCY